MPRCPSAPDRIRRVERSLSVRISNQEGVDRRPAPAVQDQYVVAGRGRHLDELTRHRHPLDRRGRTHQGVVSHRKRLAERVPVADLTGPGKRQPDRLVRPAGIAFDRRDPGLQPDPQCRLPRRQPFQRRPLQREDPLAVQRRHRLVDPHTAEPERGPAEHHRVPLVLRGGAGQFEGGSRGGQLAGGPQCLSACGQQRRPRVCHARTVEHLQRLSQPGGGPLVPAGVVSVRGGPQTRIDCEPGIGSAAGGRSYGVMRAPREPLRSAAGGEQRGRFRMCFQQITGRQAVRQRLPDEVVGEPQPVGGRWLGKLGMHRFGDHGQDGPSRHPGDRGDLLDRTFGAQHRGPGQHRHRRQRQRPQPGGDRLPDRERQRPPAVRDAFPSGTTDSRQWPYATEGRRRPTGRPR